MTLSALRITNSIPPSIPPSLFLNIFVFAMTRPHDLEIQICFFPCIYGSILDLDDLDPDDLDPDDLDPDDLDTDDLDPDNPWTRMTRYNSPKSRPIELKFRV